MWMMVLSLKWIGFWICVLLEVIGSFWYIGRAMMIGKTRGSQRVTWPMLSSC